MKADDDHGWLPRSHIPCTIYTILTIHLLYTLLFVTIINLFGYSFNRNNGVVINQSPIYNRDNHFHPKHYSLNPGRTYSPNWPSVKLFSSSSWASSLRTCIQKKTPAKPASTLMEP